ncbi:MAG TPA: hypothetical protein VNQ76_09325 [Planctomicrobium sp.]|nr:hypothetical protein [Planctomicrobium sp.]
MPQSSDIYRRLTERCLPYQLPAPWNRLDTSDVAVTVPPDLQEIVDELVNEFGLDAVLKSRIVSQASSGPVIADTFTACDGILVPVYDLTGTKIIDLITSTGCLSGLPVPVIPAYDDEEVLEDLGNTVIDVTIACSLPEFVLFLALGMPATFYSGPDHHPDGYSLITAWMESKYAPRRRPVSADQPLPHESETELIPTSDYPDMGETGCELILVAVDLINFTPSRSAQSEYLEALVKSHPNRPYLDISRWSLSEEEIKQLKTMLDTESPKNLRSWILDSRESSLVTLDLNENLPAEPAKANFPGDLLGMLDLIYADSSDSLAPSGRGTADEAHQHLNSLIYQQLSRPLLMDAESQVDPALANIQTQFAVLSHLCFSQAASLLV